MKARQRGDCFVLLPSFFAPQCAIRYGRVLCQDDDIGEVALTPTVWGSEPFSPYIGSEGTAKTGGMSRVEHFYDLFSGLATQGGWLIWPVTEDTSEQRLAESSSPPRNYAQVRFVEWPEKQRSVSWRFSRDALRSREASRAGYALEVKPF